MDLPSTISSVTSSILYKTIRSLYKQAVITGDVRSTEYLLYNLKSLFCHTYASLNFIIKIFCSNVDNFNVEVYHFACKTGTFALIRDDTMETAARNPSIRQGRFFGMDEDAKRKYISLIKKRIMDGYYFSEKVMTYVVDEIAPVLNETIDDDKIL